jgi:hypothetical protein
MRPPASHGLIWRGIAAAGTPAIAALGASYAVDFSRRLKNDELLPPSAADSPTGKIDEHREDESSELRRQAVHGSGAAPSARIGCRKCPVGATKSTLARANAPLSHR